MSKEYLKVTKIKCVNCDEEAETVTEGIVNAKGKELPIKTTGLFCSHCGYREKLETKELVINSV